MGGEGAGAVVSPASRWPAQSHSHGAAAADGWAVHELVRFCRQGSSWAKHRARAALGCESLLLCQIGLRRPIWVCLRPKRGVPCCPGQTDISVCVCLSECQCCVSTGLYQLSLSPGARVVEAVKKAPFSFPFCAALASFAVVLTDNMP